MQRGDELDALLSCVRQSPQDWDGWRVLADWLSEHGDARGQLVRLAHTMATSETSAEQRRELQCQIDALVRAHQRQWLEGLDVSEGTELEWQHGFIVKAAPGWNEGKVSFLAALLAHKSGRLLRTLNLAGSRLGDEGAAALAASASLSALDGLDLGYNYIGNEGAAALAASVHLAALRELTLRGNHIGDEGAAALAASANLSALEVLDLSNNRIGDAGAVALASSVRLAALRELNLSYNGIRAAGAAALTASPHLRGCRVHT